MAEELDNISEAAAQVTASLKQVDAELVEILSSMVAAQKINYNLQDSLEDFNKSVSSVDVKNFEAVSETLKTLANRSGKLITAFEMLAEKSNSATLDNLSAEDELTSEDSATQQTYSIILDTIAANTTEIVAGIKATNALISTISTEQKPNKAEEQSRRSKLLLFSRKTYLDDTSIKKLAKVLTKSGKASGVRTALKEKVTSSAANAVFNGLSKIMSALSKAVTWLANPVTVAGVIGGAIAIGSLPLVAAVGTVGLILAYVAYKVLKPLSEAFTDALRKLKPETISKMANAIMKFLPWCMLATAAHMAITAASALPSGAVVGGAIAAAFGAYTISAASDISAIANAEESDTEVSEKDSAILDKLDEMRDIFVETADNILTGIYKQAGAVYELIDEVINSADSIRNAVWFSDIFGKLRVGSYVSDVITNATTAVTAVATTVTEQQQQMEDSVEFEEAAASISPTDSITDSKNGGNTVKSINQLLRATKDQTAVMSNYFTKMIEHNEQVETLLKTMAEKSSSGGLLSFLPGF